jgi:hypothetical protein
MDKGENGEVRYELIKGHGELFKVCRRTGEITLKQNLEGHNREYELMIGAYDGGKFNFYYHYFNVTGHNSNSNYILGIIFCSLQNITELPSSVAEWSRPVSRNLQFVGSSQVEADT